MIKTIEKNDQERVRSSLHIEFVVDIWYTDIPEDELDMRVTELIRDQYKGWSVLLKLKPKISIHRRPDIKISLRRSSVNFRSYLFVFKNISFDRKNKQIYIQADKAVDYGFVAQAIGEIRSAGIFSIGLITTPKAIK